jgi:hypothetical protein
MELGINPVASPGSGSFSFCIAGPQFRNQCSLQHLDGWQVTNELFEQRSITGSESPTSIWVPLRGSAQAGP